MIRSVGRYPAHPQIRPISPRFWESFDPFWVFFARAKRELVVEGVLENRNRTGPTPSPVDFGTPVLQNFRSQETGFSKVWGKTMGIG